MEEEIENIPRVPPSMMPPTAAASPVAQHSPQSSPPHRILVVDDDASIRRVIGEMLAHCGYRLDEAPDGAVAWEALHTAPYDLLITDHDMPRLSGIALIEKLNAARISIPTILMSGALPTEEANRNSAIHSVPMLLKPFTPDELLRMVEDIVSTDQ